MTNKEELLSLRNYSYSVEEDPLADTNNGSDSEEEIDTNDSIEIIISDNTTNYEEVKGKFKWTHNSISLMLDEYEKRITKFRDPTVKKKDLWFAISQEMKNKGYIVFPELIDKKMRNMRSTFTKTVDSNKRKVGTGKVMWKYFKRFEQMFGADKSVVSVNATEKLPIIEEIILYDDYIEEKFSPQSPATNTIPSSPTTHDHFDVFRNSQFEFNINNNLPGSTDYENTTNYVELLGNKFTWSHKSILLLLDEYEKRITKFRDSKIKKKDLWLEISQEMKNKGYTVYPEIIDKKMRNMRGTYTKIVDSNKRTPWEYFEWFERTFPTDKTVIPENYVLSFPFPAEVMEKGEHIEETFSPQLPATSTTTSVSTRLNEFDVFRKQELEDEAQKDETQNIRVHVNTDSNCSMEISNYESTDIHEELLETRFIWTNKSVLFLLDEYEKRITKFRDPTVKKKNLWFEISEEMKKKGYIVHPELIDRKVRNMRSTYTKIVDNNNKKEATGTGRITWEYFKRFEQIFTTNETIIPLSSPKQVVENNGYTKKTVPKQSSKSSNLRPSTSTKKKRLENFRRRQLEIEADKVNEIRNIRHQLERYNDIQERKLVAYEKYLAFIQH
ncbi:hypothetical protein FQA39_LY11595 [Lamprigera yunnana]|nr:hypothetical protein FQA39_LY11595 [Lamprigera yunnana]